MRSKRAPPPPPPRKKEPVSEFECVKCPVTSAPRAARESEKALGPCGHIFFINRSVRPEVVSFVVHFKTMYKYSDEEDK